MRFGSLFSGIGAPETAWQPLGWQCAWVAEIDPFARAVLASRFPGVPNLGDVMEIDPDAVEPVDLVVFGSPCQDFSVAGKRKGMDGERGNLSLVALALVAKLRPRWLVFENVPGLLSNWSGEAPGDLADGEEWEGEQYSDFAAFLSAVRECGYLGCWRVYDAQHFGVPQRRRRVFFVGYLGDWRPAAAVLFEPESLRGDSPPRRETGERIAAGLTRGADSGGKGGYAGRRREDDINLAFAVRPPSHDAAWKGDGADNLLIGTLSANGKAAGSATQQDAEAGMLIAAFGGNNTAGDIDVATAVNAHGGPHGRLDFESETFIAHTLRADGFDASEDGTGRGTPIIPIQYADQLGREKRQNGMGLADDGAPMFTLERRQAHGVGYGTSVRRLTPRECERLQGFPDNWTAITYRGKPAADGPRYRALGNSMAVPVVRWIGERISAQAKDASAIGPGR